MCKSHWQVLLQLWFKFNRFIHEENCQSFWSGNPHLLQKLQLMLWKSDHRRSASLSICMTQPGFCSNSAKSRRITAAEISTMSKTVLWTALHATENKQFKPKNKNPLIYRDAPKTIYLFVFRKSSCWSAKKLYQCGVCDYVRVRTKLSPSWSFRGCGYNYSWVASQNGFHWI